MCEWAAVCWYLMIPCIILCDWFAEGCHYWPHYTGKLVWNTWKRPFCVISCRFDPLCCCIFQQGPNRWWQHKAGRALPSFDTEEERKGPKWHGEQTYEVWAILSLNHNVVMNHFCITLRTSSCNKRWLYMFSLLRMGECYSNWGQMKWHTNQSNENRFIPVILNTTKLLNYPSLQLCWQKFSTCILLDWKETAKLP